MFPAAGYVALAIEATRTLAHGKAVESLELRDLTIPRAITFEEDTSLGVETLVTLTAITEDMVSNTTTADFSCYSCPADGAEHAMELMASCSTQITFSDATINLSEFPLAKAAQSNMNGRRLPLDWYVNIFLPT